MAFDADKTRLIWVPLKKPDVKTQPILVFEDQDVSFTLEQVEDLGILFVSTLPWTPHIEKRRHDAYGCFISLKKGSQSSSQVHKKLLPTKPTLNLSKCMAPKPGSQVRQILRSSKNFKALLPGGCLVRHLINAT